MNDVNCRQCFWFQCQCCNYDTQENANQSGLKVRR